MKQTLYIDQGTDWAINRLLTNTDGTAANVVGYVFNGVVRKNYYSTFSSANLEVTLVDAPNGNIYISLDAANTANLEEGNYLYTITQKDTANQVTILQDGFFVVVPSVINTQPTPQTVVFPQTLPNTSYFNTANSNQFA